MNKPPVSSSRSKRAMLRPKEAAVYLNRSASSLAKDRMSGMGPPYVKVGKRSVVYDPDVLDAWLAGRTRLSTAQG